MLDYLLSHVVVRRQFLPSFEQTVIRDTAISESIASVNLSIRNAYYQHKTFYSLQALHTQSNTYRMPDASDFIRNFFYIPEKKKGAYCLCKEV